MGGLVNRIDVNYGITNRKLTGLHITHALYYPNVKTFLMGNFLKRIYMVSAGRCDGMFAPTNPRK